MNVRQSKENRFAGSGRRASTSRLAFAVLVAAVALASSSVTAAPDRATVKTLLDAISSERDYSDSAMKLDHKIKLAVELGETALPALGNRLERATGEDERRSVGNAIAYIGGSNAVRILQEDLSRSPSVMGKSLLAFAVPSAPSKDLITVLVSFLDGPHIGDSWFPIVQSAYSLGIMRERSAIPALQATRDKQTGYATFASSAARDALVWINGPDAPIRFARASPDDDLIQAIVSSGLPSLERRSTWCEQSTARRTWRKTQQAWVVDAGCKHASGAPKIRLDAYRSSDGLRAVIAVGFFLGPKDGAGYNYVLRRQGDHWQVSGVEPTWVS